MISTIVSMLGTSVGGAVFGQFASFFQNRAEERIKADQQRHEQMLAANNQLQAYYEKMGKSNPEINHTLGHIIWLLSAAYCATFILFALYPGWIIHTLDPTDEPRKLSFLFGLFAFEWKPKQVIEITTGGAALMMAYPIIFILSAVLTGIVPRRYR